MISSYLLNSESGMQWDASLSTTPSSKTSSTTSTTAETPGSKRDFARCYMPGNFLQESSAIQKGPGYIANPSMHSAEGIVRNDIIELQLGEKVFLTKSLAETLLIVHGKDLIDRKTTTKHSYDGISLVHERLNELTKCAIPAENPSSVERYSGTVPP